ncbi:hypothetical protein M6G53_15335 [Serratia nevei]|uniref:hypothetical protein n=1 Tax=Serratia nevei TaxID=2703794 RepID=UPI0020A1FC4D|nr:hypothetical protein [Serratia nevei]MCP1106755.1 hypothetical protein [Serratia nevei]
MAKEDAVDKRKALTSGPIITVRHREFLFYLFPHGEKSTFQQTLFDGLFSLHVNWSATCATLYCPGAAKSPARKAGLFIQRAD